MHKVAAQGSHKMIYKYFKIVHREINLLMSHCKTSYYYIFFVPNDSFILYFPWTLLHVFFKRKIRVAIFTL